MKTIINNSKKSKGISLLSFILTYTASAFSIIFASSIVFEAKTFLNFYLFILLCGFLAYFLFINEKTKIDESRKLKPNYIRLFIPFLVTFCSTVIGIYLLTNKTFDNNINISNQKSELTYNIELKYNHKIDSINTLDYYNTNDYAILTTQIKEFKKFTFDTIQRKFNKTMVANLYTQIINNKAKFDANKDNQVKSITQLKTAESNKANINTANNFKVSGKHNFISFFFVCLSILLEFTIFTLNRNIGKKLIELNEYTQTENVKDFLLYRNMLNFIYEIYTSGDIINFNTINYSYFAKKNNLEFTKVKEIYDTFISVGILEKFTDFENENNDIEKKEKTKFEIKFNKNQALKRFDKCFEYVLN
jgi:hypothetical protein